MMSKFQIVTRDIFFSNKASIDIDVKKKIPWIGIIILIISEFIGLGFILYVNGFKGFKVNVNTVRGVIEVASLNMAVLMKIQCNLIPNLKNEKVLMMFFFIILGISDSMILFTRADMSSSSLLLWFIAALLKNISLFAVVFTKEGEILRSSLDVKS